MEYTEMIDKVKALAAQNRAAKTAEDKAEVRRQMDALKESDLALARPYHPQHSPYSHKENHPYYKQH